MTIQIPQIPQTIPSKIFIIYDPIRKDKRNIDYSKGILEFESHVQIQL
jgi:hypothetical protein